MRIVLKFLTYALMSIVTSALLMIFSICLFTGKFPPDFKKMIADFKNIKEISKNFQSLQSGAGATGADGKANSYTDCADVDELLVVKKVQERLDKAINGEPGSGEDKKYDGDPGFKKQFTEIQFQVFRLQQRVADLETQLEALQKHPNKK